MNLKRLLLLLTCTLLTASPVAAQASEANHEAPVINDYWPHSGSATSVIVLSGFRLGIDEPEAVKIIVIQNGIEMPARTTGGSGMTNDRLNGPQTLQVIVPEDVVFGPAQIVAERNGFRSAPVTITITEWTPPIIKEMTPATGPPGTMINIQCENFHLNDELELTDGEGRPVELRGGRGGSSNGTAFIVPEDFPEGVLTIRFGNRKFGKGQLTLPVEFVVTNEALPVELLPEWTKSVAPGQWIDLMVKNFPPLKYIERTEVSFKQVGREIIVNAPRPRCPRVEVPAILSPGEVQVQARTWRQGHPSPWSIPVTLQLADKPLPPDVQALKLERGHWEWLLPGPDRATRFTASPGDLIGMHGHYPVAGADKLKVLLMRLGEVVELEMSELYEKADCLDALSVRLPAEIASGNWRMVVRAVDGTQQVMPIPIRISRK